MNSRTSVTTVKCYEHPLICILDHETRVFYAMLVHKNARENTVVCIFIFYFYIQYDKHEPQYVFLR